MAETTRSELASTRQLADQFPPVVQHWTPAANFSPHATATTAISSSFLRNFLFFNEKETREDAYVNKYGWWNNWATESVSEIKENIFINFMPEEKKGTTLQVFETFQNSPYFLETGTAWWIFQFSSGATSGDHEGFFNYFPDVARTIRLLAREDLTIHQ